MKKFLPKQRILSRSVICDRIPARNWLVHTSEKTVITIQELRCLPNLEYDVENSNTVDEYWPIRIMVRGQKVFMTFSRVVFLGKVLRPHFFFKAPCNISNCFCYYFLLFKAVDYITF